MLATLALRGRGGGRGRRGTVSTAMPWARELRRQTPRVQETLKRILLSRAFTCYQTMALLAKLPVDGTPVVVLDLLATFRDENVSWGKRRRLLDSSLNLLKRISAGAPVAVWACTHAPPLKEDPLLLTAPAGNRPRHLETSGTRNPYPPITVILESEKHYGTHTPFRHPTHSPGRSRTGPASAAPCAGDDQLAFDDLLTTAQKHISAIAYASHALPTFESFLMAMLLEEHKEVMRLREVVNVLQEMHA